MTAKKHSKRTTSDKTTQGRQTKDATDDTVPAQTATSAEPGPVETAESPSVPTAETAGIDTPVPTEAENIAPAPTVPNQPAKSTKLSAVDAAAKVLSETGQAMTCAELIAAMAAQGYWSSPTGRTPAGTLYSAVLREIQTKGDKARFRKTERGKFGALVKTVQG